MLPDPERGRGRELCGGPGRGRGPTGDQGFILVWFGVMLALLLGAAALAVDLVHALREAEAAQKAADAAALGGAVLLPEQVGDAQATALELSADNGFDDGHPDVTVTATVGDRPTQLDVEVRTEVETFFAGVLGIDSIGVTRDATAEFDQPVAMGSPANTFGNQPDCGDAPGGCTNVSGAESPDLWVNVAGPDSNKQKGDAHQANLCGAFADMCPDGGTNLDYEPAGYGYVIRNRAGGADLEIDVFDAPFVGVGDFCTAGVANLDGLFAATGDDPRYARGASEYCTGDQLFDEGGGVPPDVRFQVVRTNNTPWTKGDDEPVAGCDVSLEGFTGDLQARWNAEGAPGYSGDRLVRDWFRQWRNVCTIAAAPADDYILYVTSTSGGGHNRMALRASRGGSLTDADVSIFGDERMAIYANATGADTQFFLAKVAPGAAGRTLNLRFYDTGDAAELGTITVLPPDPALNSGHTVPTSFSACTYTDPPGDSQRDLDPPFGDMVPTDGSDCSVSDVSKDTGWQGQWVQWDVPIPPDYDCDFDSAVGCWIRIDFDYPSGSVNDTTTWTARLSGNPVRLVE